MAFNGKFVYIYVRLVEYLQYLNICRILVRLVELCSEIKFFFI